MRNIRVRPDPPHVHAHDLDHPTQPKKRTGGGGNGDELFVRELIEPEKSVILTSWRDYAQRDGGDKFAECIEILNKMVRTRRQTAGW